MSNTCPIEIAKAAVTDTNKATRPRSLRTAAERAALAAYGPFTITDRIALPADSPKFKAWISGARGLNGFVVEGTDGKRRPVGLTTIQSWLSMDPKAVTNADAFKIPTAGQAGDVADLSHLGIS